MTAHVISHRQPRRKRRRRSFLLRRFGVLAVTVAALGAASWLAPYVYRPPPPPLDTAATVPVSIKRPPTAEEVKVFTVAEPAPRAEPRRASRASRGVALDAPPSEREEDFEILTAAELDAISQARN